MKDSKFFSESKPFGSLPPLSGSDQGKSRPPQPALVKLEEPNETVKRRLNLV